jgi:hypothetical protein
MGRCVDERVGDAVMNVDSQPVRPMSYYGPQFLVPLYVSRPVAAASFVTELMYGRGHAAHYWARRRVTRAILREIRRIRRAMRRS